MITFEDGRYYCTSRCLSASWLVPLRIESADGYHLLILRNYRDAISEAGGFKPPKYTGNIPTYEDIGAQPSAEKLGLFSVKWVVSGYKLSDNQFREVGETESYTLYENQLYKARIRFENSQQNIIRKIEENPNEVTVETIGVSDKLILADNYYPGWEVFIDNDKKELLIEKGWARAVYVPGGKHVVSFRFEPFKSILDL